MDGQINLSKFPDYYKKYSWHDKHGLFGYPPDNYPAFEWIRSLERRFLHYREHPDSTPLYLIREMIQWGGSQNGVLEKFDNALGTYCLQTKLNAVLEGIQAPRNAIRAALDVPGLGLTYASKLLRFLDPEKYGALDGRIRKALARLEPPPIPKIYDGNISSMVGGYHKFIEYIDDLRFELANISITRPAEHGDRERWRAAEVEMALFQWSSESIDQAGGS
jgi:hypothetical protein